MKIGDARDLKRFLKDLPGIPIVHHGMNSDDDTAYIGIGVGVIDVWMNKATGRMIFNEYGHNLGEEWTKIKALVMG